MNCEIFRKMIGSYIDETLDEDRRDWFRSHLRECVACRNRALREEPSLFFTAAQDPPVNVEAVEACVSSVTARIRHDRLERRLNRNYRPWLAVAAAAIIVLGGGIAWLGMTGYGLPSKPSAESSRSFEVKTPPPSVEVEMESDTVRVYQFAAEDNSDSAMYFIVDPAMEL
jgi:anti-sigma factor RsiW